MFELKSTWTKGLVWIHPKSGGGLPIRSPKPLESKCFGETDFWIKKTKN